MSNKELKIIRIGGEPLSSITITKKIVVNLTIDIVNLILKRLSFSLKMLKNLKVE